MIWLFDRKKEILIGILMVIVVVALILLGIHISKNTSREIIYQKGIVVGQNHDTWYKDDTRYERWETKVNTDTGEIFIDHSKKAYNCTAPGQEVKVKRTDVYYKDKLTLTYYDVIIE